MRYSNAHCHDRCAPTSSPSSRASSNPRKVTPHASSKLPESLLYVRDVAAAAAEFVQTPNLDNEDERSRRVLAAVACGGDVPLEVEQCAAIAGVVEVPAVLANLMRRGLVQHVAPGFRLAAGLTGQLKLLPNSPRVAIAQPRHSLSSRSPPAARHVGWRGWRHR